MLVREWMTSPPVAVTPTTSILEARRLLRRHGIRHLPVVAGGTLVGIVSSHDLQINDDLLMSSLGTLQSDLLTGRYRPVETVLTRPVHTCFPWDSIERASRLMLARRVSALPVVEGRSLVGMLSLTDCVLALLDAQGREAAVQPVPPASESVS